MRKNKLILKKLKKRTIKISNSAISGLAIITERASHYISESVIFKSLNDYSSEVSKELDAKFIMNGITKIMTPANHRIMDQGHDFLETITRAKEVGEQNGWDNLTIFQEWAKAYFTDLSSNAGMPIFGKYSDEMYSFLRKIGFEEELARDFVTINGQETTEALLGATAAAMALFFSWKKSDKEAFSKTVGAILCSGAITLNPASISVAVIALAFGFNRLVCKETIAKGAISTSAGILLSASIPGPALLGAIPALTLSIYLSRKMGKDFRPVEFSLKLFETLKSEEFRSICLELYIELKERLSVKKEAV
jgi:hypothetical protein